MLNDPHRDEKLIQRMISQITAWLKTNQENQQAIKPLTEILEVLTWARDTIISMPDDARNKYLAGPILLNYEKTYSALQDYLPSLPAVNIAGVASIASSTSAMTSGTLFVMGPTTQGSAEHLAWFQERKEKLVEIQKKQMIIQRIRNYIDKLQVRDSSPPDILQEYEFMTNKVEQAIYSGDMESISAGISMRNLLNHYKGKLINLARKTPKENMTWRIMTERLCILPTGSLAYDTVLNEEETWAELQSGLSNMAKNTSRDSIQLLYIRLLTHLSTVLSLIRLE